MGWGTGRESLRFFSFVKHLSEKKKKKLSIFREFLQSVYVTLQTEKCEGINSAQ